jgi:hypothetical protein
MSAIEKFVDDLNDVVALAKEQTQVNEKLRIYDERIETLNAQLREYGKRIAELETRQVDSSELKDLVNKVVQEELSKRKTESCKTEIPLTFDVAKSETHDFFYRKLQSLGVDIQDLRKVLGYDTFVVGCIVLESVLCQNLESALPIKIFTSDRSKFGILLDDYCCRDDAPHKFTLRKNGICVFKVYHFEKLDDVHAALEMPTSLDFCRNFFNGGDFVMKDYEAVLEKRHVQYDKIVHPGWICKFASYQKFGFKFTNEKKPAVEKVRQQKILGYGDPRVKAHVSTSSASSVTSPAESLRKGVKCENPVNKVSAERVRMRDNFNALCEEYGILQLVNSVIFGHSNTSHRLAFSGNIVSASVIGNTICGGGLSITTTMKYNVMYEILRNSGLYFVETLGEADCQAATWSNASTTRVSGATVTVLAAEHADFAKVQRSVRNQRGMRCEYNGETFSIMDYDKFIYDFTRANPNMETRDVFVDYNNVASFSRNSTPLTFKLASETTSPPQVETPASSAMYLRKGIKSENRSHEVEFEPRNTMIGRFWELCKKAKIDTLVNQIIDLHKTTQGARFTISGRLVLAAIFNINPVHLTISITSNIPDAVRPIILADGKRVITGSGLLPGIDGLRHTIFLQTETSQTLFLIGFVNGDFDWVRNSVRSEQSDNCEFDGEKFFIADYDNFMPKFAFANPGIETRDVYVDEKNVAWFAGDCDTLAVYKFATMKDYFDKFLDQFGKDADAIRELIALPKAVVIGSQVRDAIKGKIGESLHVHLICFDFLQVLNIMNRRGYAIPKICELSVHGMKYFATNFTCLSGTGDIHIRIPNNIADDKQRSFIEYFLQENYEFDCQCTFDGAKFRNYEFTEKDSRVVRIYREYPVDTLPQ